VDECDALAYLAEDEQTRIVGMYLEDIRDGRRFLDVARRSVAEKPVLMVKGGCSPDGARASASHTASQAVDDAVLNGALRQAGVLRMANIDEMVATLIGFQGMPLPRGDRLALVTYSGAQAIMSIDVATEEGLGLARFTEKTRQRLAGVIATPSKAKNPIDIYPDMMAYGFEKTCTEILGALIEDEGVHGILFIAFAISGAAPFRPLVDVIEARRSKPVFFSLLGTAPDLEASRTFLRQHGIPFYLFPETAVHVFSHMLRYARLVGRA
jgi:acyl-CoA synthetase (NDP forming)